jgi:hypothetical protein
MPPETSLYIGEFRPVAGDIAAAMNSGAFPVFSRCQWSEADTVAMLVSQTGRPVAIARLAFNAYAQGKPQLILHSLEVAGSDRNKGLSSVLARGIFDYAAKCPDGPADILYHGFTADGQKYLLKKTSELSRETGVSMIFLPYC